MGDVFHLDSYFGDGWGEEGSGASGANNFLLAVASIFPVVSGLFIAEDLRI